MSVSVGFNSQIHTSPFDTDPPHTWGDSGSELTVGQRVRFVPDRTLPDLVQCYSLRSCSLDHISTTHSRFAHSQRSTHCGQEVQCLSLLLGGGRHLPPYRQLANQFGSLSRSIPCPRLARSASLRSTKQRQDQRSGEQEPAIYRDCRFRRCIYTFLVYPFYEFASGQEPLNIEFRMHS